MCVCVSEIYFTMENTERKPEILRRQVRLLTIQFFQQRRVQGLLFYSSFVGILNALGFYFLVNTRNIFIVNYVFCCVSVHS